MRVILDQAGMVESQLDLLILGTTLATNALIERKGCENGVDHHRRVS